MPAVVIGGQPFAGPSVIDALSAPLTVMMQRWIVEISLVAVNWPDAMLNDTSRS